MLFFKITQAAAYCTEVNKVQNRFHKCNCAKVQNTSVFPSSRYRLLLTHHPKHWLKWEGLPHYNCVCTKDNISVIYIVLVSCTTVLLMYLVKKNAFHHLFVHFDKTIKIS